jgi:PIN domain nuclease of toxin-antitoxin system
VNTLIDTHIFLWAAGIEGNLPDKAADVLKDEKVTTYVSAVTAWEIGVKWAKGRLTLPEVPSLFVEKVILASGLVRLPVTIEDGCAVADLPIFPEHKDLFGRLLVAQAQTNGLHLITADPKLGQYDVELILCNRK